MILALALDSQPVSAVVAGHATGCASAADRIKCVCHQFLRLPLAAVCLQALRVLGVRSSIAYVQGAAHIAARVVCVADR